MKIGFFTDSYFPGIDGVTYTIKAWRERLEERGHEVYVIYPDSPKYEPEEGEYPVKSLPNPQYWQYRYPLYRRISTLPDLDVVHCHGPASTGLIGRRYANKNDLTSVYTHHTPVEDYLIDGLKFEPLANIAGKIFVAYANWFISSFDHVTASTDQINRDVDPLKIPVGLDMEFFQPADQNIFDTEKDVIGYSGRMNKRKNLGKVLELAEKMPEKKFVLVGQGPNRDRWESNAPENVEFRDFMDRERLPKFYSSIDVFITSSTCDTLGLSPLEANACGTPVAAADVTPFNRTIEQDNGERYEYGDIDDMKRAVENCLENNRDTRSAVESFSLEKTIDELEKIYGVE